MDAGALPVLIGIVAPVFVIILLGYGIGRAGIFSPDQVRGFGRLVLVIALPALIFNALANARIGQILRLDYLAVYSLASLAVFAAGFLWFRWGPGREGGTRDTAKAAVRAMGMSGSNTAFVGLPVLTQVFGAAAAGPIALNMLFENFVLLPLVLTLIEVGQGSHGHPLRAIGGIARNLVRSTMIWAIVLGTVFAVLGLVLPAPLARTVQILAGASAPLALLTIGASLAGVALHGRRAAIGVITIGKLVLHPALVLLLLLVIPVTDPMFRTSVILLAALPMFSVYPVIAQKTDDAETASAAMLMATALSSVTLVIAMAMLGVHLG